MALMRKAESAATLNCFIPVNGLNRLKIQKNTKQSRGMSIPTGPLVSTAKPIKIPASIGLFNDFSCLSLRIVSAIAEIEQKMKKLNTGSIMPDLKYTWGRKLPAMPKAQRNPKRSLRRLRPISKTVIRVMIPKMAFGSLAANSPTPNKCMHKACIQMKSGGFSQKGWKLMVTRV